MLCKAPLKKSIVLFGEKKFINLNIERKKWVNNFDKKGYYKWNKMSNTWHI